MPADSLAVSQLLAVVALTFSLVILLLIAFSK